MCADVYERITLMEERLGVKFKDRTLLLKALTHRSYQDGACDNNEILEFLGDAVLEIVVTEFLVKRYESRQEGGLSELRAALVNNQTLFRVAMRWNIQDYLLASRPMEKKIKTNPAKYKRILACTVEAILGAIYLDRGIGPCRLLVDEYIHNHLTRIANEFNPKTELQELTQKRFKTLPYYELTSDRGRWFDNRYRVTLRVKGKQIAEGDGNSIKEAESNAAKLALETIDKWEMLIEA